MAPAGTPPAVVEKINADMITASRTEAAITAVRAGGSETGDLSTVQCRDFLRRETAMWAEAAKRAEVTPE
ncbi:MULTISPECIES: tripartite tricarboxylate transporter substrate-binding protein [Cupriavidus]|uniref:Tripartite-type tricarboxylate transporter receptor subunit TctC n=1 Tax=Cupriavidus alkaliphilus TaxID=942866 RepID=A0A7W4VE87_9BURK|nr:MULTISPECIES: tripartite tricarboxylate transporter substrate-binding protein [Cupriavidus]MBB3009964.1 tripartite-type tricarboxylate transporter receptor subunit TctC [Cupriavidus alkaliphilus]GLC96678.1 hypothetical protein Tamer19_60870 [Cupriavidus sp. TA19]